MRRAATCFGFSQPLSGSYNMCFAKLMSINNQLKYVVYRIISVLTYCPSSGVLILYPQQLVFVILVMLTVLKSGSLNSTQQQNTYSSSLMMVVKN